MKTKTKMKNLIISALMLLAVLLPATATADEAYDFEVDGIYYVITGDEVTVSYKEIGEDACSAIPYYYSDYSGNVDIPSTVTHDGITYPVTSIGAFAFQNCYGLTGVTIPNSVSVMVIAHSDIATAWLAFQWATPSPASAEPRLKNAAV